MLARLARLARRRSQRPDHRDAAGRSSTPCRRGRALVVRLRQRHAVRVHPPGGHRRHARVRVHAVRGQAYESLRFITDEALFGRFLRGMHYFGASAMVLLVGIHMSRTLPMAAYKFPRELNWLTGVVLLAVHAGHGIHRAAPALGSERVRGR